MSLWVPFVYMRKLRLKGRPHFINIELRYEAESSLTVKHIFLSRLPNWWAPKEVWWRTIAETNILAWRYFAMLELLIFRHKHHKNKGLRLLQSHLNQMSGKELLCKNSRTQCCESKWLFFCIFSTWASNRCTVDARFPLCWVNDQTQRKISMVTLSIKPMSLQMSAVPFRIT